MFIAFSSFARRWMEGTLRFNVGFFYPILLFVLELILLPSCVISDGLVGLVSSPSVATPRLAYVYLLISPLPFDSTFVSDVGYDLVLFFLDGRLVFSLWLPSHFRPSSSAPSWIQKVSRSLVGSIHPLVPRLCLFPRLTL